MRIRVELAGKRFDLNLLAGCCPLTNDAGVWSEDGHHYLAYPSLDELADTPGILMDQAASTLTMMNGITRTQHENYHPVALSGQFADLHSGAQHAVAKVAAVRARTAVVTATVVVTGTEPTPPPVPPGIRMAHLASTHPRLRSVLDMMGAADAPDWTTLYKIHETIKKDVGGIPTGRWVSQKQNRRFTQTAQQYRHIEESCQPPKRPMSQPEAQEFISSLINKWCSDMAEDSGATVEADSGT